MSLLRLYPDRAMLRATGCPLPSMARATVSMYGRTGTAPHGMALGFSSSQRGQEGQGVSLGTSPRMASGPVLEVACWEQTLHWQGPRIGRKGLKGRGWGGVCGLKGLGGGRWWVLAPTPAVHAAAGGGGAPAACPHHCPEAPAN